MGILMCQWAASLLAKTLKSWGEKELQDLIIGGNLCSGALPCHCMVVDSRGHPGIPSSAAYGFGFASSLHTTCVNTVALVKDPHIRCEVSAVPHCGGTTWHPLSPLPPQSSRVTESHRPLPCHFPAGLLSWHRQDVVTSQEWPDRCVGQSGHCDTPSNSNIPKHGVTTHPEGVGSTQDL